jgi:hypothetical protein
MFDRAIAALAGGGADLDPFWAAVRLADPRSPGGRIAIGVKPRYGTPAQVHAVHLDALWKRRSDKVISTICLAIWREDQRLGYGTTAISARGW